MKTKMKGGAGMVILILIALAILLIFLGVLQVDLGEIVGGVKVNLP
jgi:hypothetical protein